ncbi:hypothetical protein SUDANB99_05957 (plasmid) [Streptomyces sp. enrichment culture]
MTTPAVGPATLKATSELLTAARALMGQEKAGEATEQASATDQVLDPGGLLSQARQAKRSYQATSRWILASFAIVGLVLFGSLPFSNIGKITGLDLLPMGIGLGCAAAGIALAIWAASIVAEPLDASLGALEQRLEPAMNNRRVRWRTDPRRRAEIRLVEMLTGNEKQAHLGPGMEDISTLIKKLGELEKKRLAQVTDAARHDEALKGLDSAVSAHLATLVELRQQAHDIGQLASTPNKRRLARELAARIKRESAAYAAAADARARYALQASASAGGSLAATQAELDTYLGHRAMILVQSAMMQMRGTFRLARLLIVIGAVLTLAGGTLYAYVLPVDTPAKSPSEGAPRQPAAAAVITVNKGTDIAGQLPDSCIGRALQALRLDQKVPSRNGPFDVIVTDPACPGSLSVPKDQGTITSPATS